MLSDAPDLISSGDPGSPFSWNRTAISRTIELSGESRRTKPAAAALFVEAPKEGPIQDQMRDLAMKPLTTTVAGSLLALAGAGYTLADSTPVPHWTVNTLSEDDYNDFKVTALNGDGLMCGYASVPGESWSVQKGFITDGTTHTFFETGEAQYYPMVINDAGVAAGYSNGSEQLVRFEIVDGVPTFTDLGDLGSGGFTPQILKINEAGMITGRVPQGSGVYRAFQWAPESGLLDVMTGTGVEVTDMNEAGEIVGTTPEGAFHWFEGELQLLPGDDALSIDDAGRVVLRTASESETSFHQYELAGGGLQEIFTIDSGNETQLMTNDAGQALVIWHIADPDDPFETEPRMANWHAETGLEQIELPSSLLQLSCFGFNGSGMGLFVGLDVEYNWQLFFSRGLHNNGAFTDLSHRVFDLCDQDLYSVVGINDAGQIALQLDVDFNLEHSALLDMARPGDVDGDGSVGVNDLLGVIAAWNEQHTDDCGQATMPDLDGDRLVNVNDLLICIGDWD